MSGTVNSKATGAVLLPPSRSLVQPHAVAGQGAGSRKTEAGGAVPASLHDRLREQAKQMEAVFTEQLFKAMRETVPQGEGAVDGGSGEEMFTGLLDQRLAADTPNAWHHGIGEALYRQLSRALPSEPTAPADAGTPAAPSPDTE